jgi:hypothetical protein
MVDVQTPLAAQLQNLLRAPEADSRDAQKDLALGPIDIHWKYLGMPQSVGQLGICTQRKLRLRRTEKILHLKAVESEQPVRLLQPVFAAQRRFMAGPQPRIRGVLGNVGGIIDTPKPLKTVQSIRQAKDFEV